MFKHRRACGLAGVVLLASACGTTTTTGGQTGSGPLANCHGAVTVASDLPTTGLDAPIGGGTERGVHMAVMDATSQHLLGGCTIDYLPKDDSSIAKGKHDPQQGAQNMTALATNPAVVGVVGPFNSSVALTEIPIANQANLLLLSPANTDPGLTQPGTDPDINTLSLRPTGHITYYRIAVNDIIQARAQAKVAYSEVGARRVYDIDDQETYGKDLSNYFDRFFTQMGGTVVKRVGLPGDTQDFHAALTDAKGLNADLIFFGGVASNGSGIIRKQMADVPGLTQNFLSGDGTVDPQFFIDAGSKGEGAVATSEADVRAVGSGPAWVQRFHSIFNADPVVYAPFGYDAMMILLTAIRQVLIDNGGTVPPDAAGFRAKVLAKVAATDYNGLVGHTTFDANGDTANTAFGVYVARSGTWVQREIIRPSAS